MITTIEKDGMKYNFVSGVIGDLLKQSVISFFKKWDSNLQGLKIPQPIIELAANQGINYNEKMAIICYDGQFFIITNE